MIDLDKLRELLIDQFLLHEVQHHGAYALQGDEAEVREPRAHSLVDVYKCLHQGEFGVGHLIDAPDRFRKRLMQEILRFQPTSDEPILENVSIDRRVMRLNLKPFKALYANDIQNASRILAKVCVQSAEIANGETEHFFSLLKGFREVNSNGELRVGNATYRFETKMVDFFLQDIEKFARRMGEIPVLSHSSGYRQLNEPSYRVVDVSVIRQSPLVSLFQNGNNT
jgi:hypothetical protein